MYPRAQTSGTYGKAMVARRWTRGHIGLHSLREGKQAQEEYLGCKEKSPQRSLQTTQGKTAELRCPGGQGSQPPGEGERRVTVHAFNSQCRKLMAERARQESCPWFSSGSPGSFLPESIPPVYMTCCLQYLCPTKPFLYPESLQISPNGCLCLFCSPALQKLKFQTLSQGRKWIQGRHVLSFSLSSCPKLHLELLTVQVGAMRKQSTAAADNMGLCATQSELECYRL